MKDFAFDLAELDAATEDTGRLIADAAYFNWVNAGRPPNRDIEFWCEAERQVLGCTYDEYWASMEEQR